MAIAETERSELVQALTSAIGERPTHNLMSSIFLEGTDHIATKAGVKALETNTEAGFVKIHAEVEGGFARVEGEFAKVEGEFAKVEGEFAKVYGVIEGLKGHFDLKLANQTRTMLLAMLALMVTTWAGMLAGFLMLASMISG